MIVRQRTGRRRQDFELAHPRDCLHAGVFQTILVDAQWIILALSVVLFVRAGPRPGIKTTIGAVLAAASAGGLLYLLSQWPAIRGLPPDPLIRACNAARDEIPRLKKLPTHRAHRAARCRLLLQDRTWLCIAAGRREAIGRGGSLCRSALRAGSNARKIFARS